MTFGARLAEARKRKQLTQDGLGRGLGTDGKDASKAVVYGWEKDQHYPRVDQLVLICEKLGVSSDYLLFGTEADSNLEPEISKAASALQALPKRWKEWALRHVWDTIETALESIAIEKNGVTQKNGADSVAARSTSDHRKTG